MLIREIQIRKDELRNWWRLILGNKHEFSLIVIQFEYVGSFSTLLVTYSRMYREIASIFRMEVESSAIVNS